MRIIFCILLLTGCSALFNADKYNPNPTPKPVVEEPVKIDTVKTDTIKVIIIE